MTAPNTPPLSPPTPRVVETTWAVQHLVGQSHRGFEVWGTNSTCADLTRDEALEWLVAYRRARPDELYRLVRRETIETVEETDA